MRAGLLALLAGAVVVGSHVPEARAADQKIGVIDVQHAVSQTEEGLRAVATMKKLFDKRQQDIDGRQNDLAKMRDEIQLQMRVLSRASLQRRMEDWQRRMIEVQTAYVEYTKELQKKQADLQGPIMKKMFAVIARAAKKNGYEIILDKQAAPYVRSDLDLTETVIQMYNAGDADEPKADPPKP